MGKQVLPVFGQGIGETFPMEQWIFLRGGGGDLGGCDSVVEICGLFVLVEKFHINMKIFAVFLLSAKRFP